MKFIDAEFVKGFIRMANDGWEQGWHERNGGNLSYRVKPEEVESVKENFEAKKWQPIGTSVPNLAGEYFLMIMHQIKYICRNACALDGFVLEYH